MPISYAETLYRMPALKTERGTMPAHLILAKRPDQCRDAERAGGVDVSADPHAWAQYDDEEANRHD